MINNVSSISNSIGYIGLGDFKNNNKICSYKIVQIKNSLNNIVSPSYENIINTIYTYEFKNFCYNSFCYIINNITDIDSYPFIGITNIIFLRKTFDNIHGCKNMKSLYLFIKWILLDNIVYPIMHNFSSVQLPNYIKFDIYNKLNSITCEYINGSVVFIKDINTYSKNIYGSGSSLISNLQDNLADLFYKLYGINIIYNPSNSYDGIINLKNNNYLFSLSEIIDYDEDLFIIPLFITSIIFIYNSNKIGNLILTKEEIKNIFYNNNNDYIKIIRNNYSGTETILKNTLFYTEIPFINNNICPINYCSENIKIDNNYFYLIIIIILPIIIVITYYYNKDHLYIKLSDIKYNADEFHHILFKGLYNNENVIIKHLNYNIVIKNKFKIRKYSEEIICSTSISNNIQLIPIKDSIFYKIKNFFVNRNKLKNNINNIFKMYHPNIIHIFGYTNDINNPLLIMEYMSLGSLHDVLYKSTIPIDNIFILNTIQQIVEGISFLHSFDVPIIHNNLKTTNILVNNSLNIKISDFNILQKKNRINKNLYYIAPEVLEYNIITTASDIYSFSIIFYELIMIREPYYNIKENLSDIISSILNKDNPLRPIINYEINPNIKKILIDCWDHNYVSRPSIIVIKNIIDNFKKDCINVIDKLVKYTNNIQQVLTDMFPNNISNSLLYSKKILPITYNNISILFLDICNYTNLSSMVSNDVIINLLERFYNDLDDLTKSLNLVKIGNVGDAYIVCSDLNVDNINNIKSIALFGLDAIKIASKTYIDLNNLSLGTINIRVGINNGNAIGHIIGKYTQRFSLFGDTINLASRMESTSEPMRMQSTKEIALLLKNIDNDFDIESRGLTNVKGKGIIHTYFINSYKNDYKIIINNKPKELKLINSFFGISMKKLIDNIEN